MDDNITEVVQNLLLCTQKLGEMVLGQFRKIQQQNELTEERFDNLYDLIQAQDTKSDILEGFLKNSHKQLPIEVLNEIKTHKHYASREQFIAIVSQMLSETTDSKNRIDMLVLRHKLKVSRNTLRTMVSDLKQDNIHTIPPNVVAWLNQSEHFYNTLGR